MSFDWREFLKLAQDLHGGLNLRCSQEAAQRSAVSRAYYAAFCYARNYAESRLGFQRTGTGRDHKLLKEHLRNLGQPWDEVADDLADLQQWRGFCDYDDEVAGLEILASNAINTAQKVIQQCT